MSAYDPSGMSGLSEKFELTVPNPYPVSVELSHNEAIEPLIVGAAIVPQEPEGLLLADEKATDAVGTVMGKQWTSALRLS